MKPTSSRGRNCAFALAALLVLFGVALPRAHAITETPDTGFPAITSTPVESVVQAGDCILIGGRFTGVDGQTRNRLAALDAVTGALWDWNPNVVGTTVSRIHVSGDKVYIGGVFSTVGGTARVNVAALNLPTGPSDAAVLDAAWNPAPNAAIYAITSHAGRIYVGGSFTTLKSGAVARNYAAALAPADGVDTATVDPWDPNLGARCRVMLVHGGRIYLGGDFTTAKGVGRGYLAAFGLADGSSAGVLDAAWNPGALSGGVFCMATDGTYLYPGGAFTSMGGEIHMKLAAVELADGIKTGDVVSAWNPVFSGNVNQVVIHEGLVVAGGSFIGVDESDYPYLVALQPATGAYAIANWNPAPDNIVVDMTASGSGLLVVGNFNSMNSVAVDNVTGFGSTVPIRFRSFSVD